jgi:hypothetical protein
MQQTEYAVNSIGSTLFQFSMKYPFTSLQTTIPTPCLHAGTTWSVHGPGYTAAQVNSHYLSEHVFSLASATGWSYKGLSSLSNFGPEHTAAGGIVLSRTAKFHLSIGYGPVAIHEDSYVNVHFAVSTHGVDTTGGWVHS